MVSQPRVLVVDDEESVRDAFADALEDLPYKVETVSGGEEALAKVKSSPADLIFLDLKMPGMNGLETLRKIKERYPLIQVVMLTAHGTIETAVEGLKMGAFDYLLKPCEIDRLV
mgnify:CR=1 FL=1